MKNLYTVKAIKTFVGMEGHGFNADLYLNNNKIAFVYDDASGGEIHFEFKTPNQETDFQKFAVEKLGSEYGDYATAEILVNDMVNELLQRRDLKALLNKKTVQIVECSPHEMQVVLRRNVSLTSRSHGTQK